MTETRKRAMRWSMLGVLLLSLILPVGAYFIATSPSVTAEEATNPRADYWREVRSGQQDNAYTAVTEHSAGTVLIQSSGQNWRQLRNGPLATYGGMILIAALVVITLFYLLHGKVKLEHPRTGHTLLRWNSVDRLLHWVVAIGFIVLAVTGLSLLFGRALLIPVFGKEGFAAYAQIARDLHHWIAPVFAVALLLMLVLWIRNNFFNQTDVRWFAEGGGILKQGHPSAGFMNGGEKMWYWVVFFGGLAVCISGFVLYLPIFGQTRPDFQLSHLVHAGFAVLWIAASFGHVYIGTIGTEGALEGMVTGHVDESWAKQHHDLWYEEMQAKQQIHPPKEGKVSADVLSSGAS